MVSAARQKVDRQTMSLFDPEVEKPDHDAIVQRLYGDPATLQRLLVEFHGLAPLVPFNDDDRIAYWDYEESRVRREVSFREAVEMTGQRPSFKDACPVRIGQRRMEVLMFLPSEPGRTSRLIGFIDVGVAYTIAKHPRLVAPTTGQRAHWEPSEDHRVALFEVKSVWPTQGALMRQLNLYGAAYPGSFAETKAFRFAVGPDASVNELLCSHRYRLITFDGLGASFALQPDPRPAAPQPVPGQF